MQTKGVLFAMLAAALLAALTAAPAKAQPQASDAKAILKAMSDYMGAQKSLSFEFDATLYPTAVNDALGQGKFQADPAAVRLYSGKYWVFGFLVQPRRPFASDGAAF